MKDNPAYGTMPSIVGASPRKRPWTPRSAAIVRSAAGYEGYSASLPQCAAICARSRSNGYVATVASAPADAPAKKRVMTSLSRSSARRQKACASSKEPKAIPA